MSPSTVGQTKPYVPTPVVVLGRTDVGVVAECGGFRYYLTPCCGASAKGLESYIGCRGCYDEVDWDLGGIPDQDGPLVEVFGDGIPWAQWARTAGVDVPEQLR